MTVLDEEEEGCFVFDFFLSFLSFFDFFFLSFFDWGKGEGVQGYGGWVRRKRGIWKRAEEMAAKLTFFFLLFFFFLSDEEEEEREESESDDEEGLRLRDLFFFFFLPRSSFTGSVVLSIPMASSSDLNFSSSLSRLMATEMGGESYLEEERDTGRRGGVEKEIGQKDLILTQLLALAVETFLS